MVVSIQFLGIFDMGPTLSASFNHFYSYSIVRLFVNGTLRGRSIPETFHGTGRRIYLTVGSSSLNGRGCQSVVVAPGQFFGTVDEFRVFNRDLREEEICALATYTV